MPSVDLSLVGHEDVRVMLLIGEKQRRLDLELVRQIHQHAAQVSLIEVGASGRNALDMVLAWHLGRSAERHPDDAFFVVSKDRDYDPLIRHLQAAGIQVQRVDSFSALPFLAASRPARRTGAGRKAASAAAAREPAPAVSAATVDERMAKLVDRLQHQTRSRPARRKTLLSHINDCHANQLSASELEGIVAALEREGVIRIDPQGRVTYPS